MTDRKPGEPKTDDETEEQTRCPYCGFVVATPCDEPPPMLCQTAASVLERSGK